MGRSSATVQVQGELRDVESDSCQFHVWGILCKKILIQSYQYYVKPASLCSLVCLCSCVLVCLCGGGIGI